MANRIRMVHKELMFSLFQQGWSDRKIHNSIGLHRKTISRYRKEWLRSQHEKSTSNVVSHPSSSDLDLPDNAVQNAPPGQNKVPTEGVVHFEVPTTGAFSSAH